MTRDEANSLLDRLRNGEHFDHRVIRDALIASGDSAEAAETPAARLATPEPPQYQPGPINAVQARPRALLGTPESALTRCNGWVECRRRTT